jgi:Cu(I)/Ag(I) efflux system membrane fusion protein
MKTIFERLHKTLCPALFLALPAFLLLAVASCAKHGAATKPPDVDYYTCTMHPSVKSQDPNAKCPICSMDLVPVKKKGAAASSAAAQESNQVQGQMENMPGMAMPSATTNATEQPSEFTVPVERQQQIGVTYGKIEKRPFALTIRAVGLVASDKQRRWDYVTRVDGYVEKLFVFSPGEIVEPDAPLLTIYSPDLLTTENEFLDVLKTRDETQSKGDRVVLESTQHLVDSVKRRLRLWNITDAQISELEKTRQPQETLTLNSPFKGIVQTLGVDQGRRVMVGDRLVEVADLSVVWVWAQFYENELAVLKKGLPVVITTSAYPGETFHGKISVVDPFLNDASRTGRVRIDVDNAGLKLRPEMYVNAELKLDLGEGLAVPVSAVLPTGQRNIVFVDKGAGKLEPRFVDLGRKFGEFYEILAGLKENERVVTSANFLIDAEAKVQGVLKSW